MITPYNFFLSQAGYSYDPARETPMQGRRRGAKQLAAAEKRAKEVGCHFHWQVDMDTDSSDFSKEEPAWCLWQCLAYDPNGDVFASLSAIDFGRDGEPFNSPYRRVVEAELACELPE